uniref:Replication protein A 70 kDa DNA-binding subunit B/D first OB fold domain-containing protein n=1 Tax=Daucus carota subsp. sativus TaxID=79200 RepID=A0A166G858_DAUCS
MFNLLRDLDHTRSDWKIRVRVTRMWTPKEATNNPFSKNLILLDREDSHLEAFVVSEAWDVLQDMMFEGQVYDIYSFVCCDSTGKLRPVSSNISIVLTSQTVVLPAPNEVSTIPRHKFEITELSQLYSLTRSYPLDVIPSHAIVEPILILASMRSIFIQGRLELISTGSTCIYVNPDYEEMRRVRLRLLDQW